MYRKKGKILMNFFLTSESADFFFNFIWFNLFVHNNKLSFTSACSRFESIIKVSGNIYIYNILGDK